MREHYHRGINTLALFVACLGKPRGQKAQGKAKRTLDQWRLPTIGND
jgi:hypothetical protein